MKFRIDSNYRVKRECVLSSYSREALLSMFSRSATSVNLIPEDILTLVEQNIVIGYGIDYTFQINNQDIYTRLVDFEASRLLQPEKLITKFRELIEKNKDAI